MNKINFTKHFHVFCLGGRTGKTWAQDLAKLPKSVHLILNMISSELFYPTGPSSSASTPLALGTYRGLSCAGRTLSVCDLGPSVATPWLHRLFPLCPITRPELWWFDKYTRNLELLPLLHSTDLSSLLLFLYHFKKNEDQSWKHDSWWAVHNRE